MDIIKHGFIAEGCGNHSKVYRQHHHTHLFVRLLQKQHYRNTALPTQTNWALNK
jgi:hypothetical protein